MPNPKDAFRQAAEDDDGSYPSSWIPEVGGVLIGTLDHYDTGSSRFGTRTIAVIRDETSGELWSVWLMASVLEAKFRELKPKPGERLYIKRHVDRKNATGTTYQFFSVKVEGRDDVSPNFRLATEVPPEQRDETVDLAPAAPSTPAPDISPAPESLEDVPEALDGDDDDDLPF